MSGGKVYLVPSGRRWEKMDAKGKLVVTEPMALIHHCFKEGCERDAPFGYEVNLRRDHFGWWSCSEHKAEADQIIDQKLGRG